MPRERLPVRTYGTRGVLRRRLVRDVEQRIKIGRQPFLLSRNDNGRGRGWKRRAGARPIRCMIDRDGTTGH